MNILIKIPFELGLLFVQFADVEVQPVFRREVGEQRVEGVFLEQVQLDGREREVDALAEGFGDGRESV